MWTSGFRSSAAERESLERLSIFVVPLTIGRVLTVGNHVQDRLHLHTHTHNVPLMMTIIQVSAKLLELKCFN